MYEERREKFSFKSFFLTLLLVLLFVFLMLWLFPTKNYINSKLGSTNDIENLSILYDEIFANNVARMKDGAVGYFTNERLPKTVGESKKLTLQEMYELHLVLQLKDKDGNPCDTTRSYAEVTKYTEEYRLKVNLSCGTQEDYIIVYLGCYDYCPNGTCEKKVATPSKKTQEEIYSKASKYICKVIDGKYYDANGEEVNKTVYDRSCTKSEPEKKYYCKVVDGKYYDNNGKVVSKADYEKACTTPEPQKYYCKVVDGKYYDNNGKEVDKTAYDKACTTPEPQKYYCKVVDGKYYDNNGKEVSKAEYEKACTTPEPQKYYCKVVDDKYYDNNGKVVSKSEYEKACTTPEPQKYYCKVVDGKYYDNNGKVVSKSEYEKACTTPQKYLYEYKLDIKESTSCSNWSNWQKNKITPTSTIKVETKTEKEITDYKTVKVPVTKTEKVKKQVNERYISRYITELVKTGTKEVQTGTTTKTTTERVQVGTIEQSSGTIGTGSRVPQNTSSTHYKVLSVDTRDACNYCENKTTYTWEVYKVVPVYDVVTRTEEVPVYRTINVYETKEVPIYDFRTVEKEEEVTTTTYEDKKEPVYGTVTYYRSRECKTTPGSTDIKWSESKSDTSLISKGYVLTGNSKKA